MYTLVMMRMHKDDNEVQMEHANKEHKDAIRQVIPLICSACASITSIAVAYVAQRYLLRSPPQDREAQRMAFINGIINVSDIECRNQTWMCRVAFFDLRDKLESSRKLVVTRGVSVEEQLLLFTHMLSYSIQNRPIRYYLGRSRETINRHFHRVLRVILGLYSELVKYPTADYINQMPIQHREYFKDCIGAIDGTHIPTMIPLQEQGKWRNHKHEITQNVLAVVGHDMKFHYVLAGWEGSATDARVMQSALTRPGDPLKVPDGKYYVVDCGYANAPCFLAPYRNSKYHLSTYRDNHRPQDPKELFNHQHASVRNVVECVFGLLKGRFPILKVEPNTL